MGTYISQHVVGGHARQAAQPTLRQQRSPNQRARLPAAHLEALGTLEV